MPAQSIEGMLMKILSSSSRSIISTAIILVFSLFLYSNASSASYKLAIQQGRMAAQEVLEKHGATAITIALVDANHIIWSQSFGIADFSTQQAPNENTMFGTGSVSKVIATIAVMKLVEKGVIDLDTRVVTYLPNFKMASEGYKSITVRMLLNHSSGFPGTDYRNGLIRHRVPRYLDQVLQTLSQAKLNAPPGYMSVYCNDGFTVVEALIEAISGKTYAQFVQDEILSPLNMINSRYPDQAFSKGSYASAIVNGQLRPQEFINLFASGGLYSTANDLARIAMMFLGNGAIGPTRIISEKSVAAMAMDQTAHTFNPVHSNTWAYGLGWDSVSQPGLLAVGYNGWIKGGDSLDYGAVIMVSPQAGLGIVVIGASGFGSEKAKAIGEQVLLRALAENGKIASFPLPFKANEYEENKNQGKSNYKEITGTFAASEFIFKFQEYRDQLRASILSEVGWPKGMILEPLQDSWFRSAQDPLKTFKVLNANLMDKQTQYVAMRSPSGYGHYLDSNLAVQKIAAKQEALSKVWRSRLHLTWLVVNEHPDELTWNGMDPRLRLTTAPELQGLIILRPPVDPDTFHVLDPSTSDYEATPMLIIPQLNGRDLDELRFIKHNNEEWARIGSYMHRPLPTVSKLISGKTEKLTIGPEGYAEWRTIALKNKPVKISIKTKGTWRIYDNNFKSLASGDGNTVTKLLSGNGLSYLTVFGNAGDTITIDLIEKAGKQTGN